MSPPRSTRRGLLKSVSALAWGGGLSACSWRAGSGRRSTGRPAVGFLRQTDAASLLMADELGICAKHGLAPVLLRGTSPTELRARLLAGELAAAQLSASCPTVEALRSGGQSALRTIMVLSHNGGGVTLGRELCAEVKFLDLSALRKTLLKRPAATPAAFAVPILGGADDLMLRYLLAAAGIPADRVLIAASPPERMLADLREERIVGFAAPDPWGGLAAGQDLGFTFATAQDVCRTGPRSVLVTTTNALSQRRDELKALVRAVSETSVWLDVPANRGRALVGEVLARGQNLDLDAGPIRARLGSVYDLGCRLGERDFEDDMLFFHRGGRVNLPLRGDALLFAALLARFGLTPAPVNAAAVAAVASAAVQDGLYREVARDTGLSLPADMKPFVVTLDAVRFDPNVPSDWPRLWASPAIPNGTAPF